MSPDAERRRVDERPRITRGVPRITSRIILIERQVWPELASRGARARDGLFRGRGGSRIRLERRYRSFRSRHCGGGGWVFIGFFATLANLMCSRRSRRRGR